MVKLSSNGDIYRCNVGDARPAGTQPCTAPCCPGKWVSKDADGTTTCIECDAAPPMGKPWRSEPALVEQRGVLSVELPRTHPRMVQGIQAVTEWWMANDDQGVIVCRSAPEECTADELAEVAHYVPGYMTKGGRGSSEYAAIFRTMLNDSDVDMSVKTLVRRLLIRITGKDFPRQQARLALPHVLVSCAAGHAATQLTSMPSHCITLYCSHRALALSHSAAQPPPALSSPATARALHRTAPLHRPARSATAS